MPFYISFHKFRQVQLVLPYLTAIICPMRLGGASTAFYHMITVPGYNSKIMHMIH